MTTPRERLLARARDEAAGPPSAGISPTPEVALRCTEHGRFILWVCPPAPSARVACPPECGVPQGGGPALVVDLT